MDNFSAQILVMISNGLLFDDLTRTQDSGDYATSIQRNLDMNRLSMGVLGDF